MTHKIILLSLLSFFLIITSFIFLPVYAQNSKNDSEYISAILEGSPEEIKIALNQTRQFLSDNPYHVEERANECSYLLKLKLLDETQTCLEKAASDFPNDLVIQENLGGFYFLNEEYSAAKTQLGIVYNLDPENTTHYSNYLSARVMAGDDPDEIILEIKNLIKKDPSVSNLFLTIAKLLNDKNQPAEARKYLEEIPITKNTSVKVYTQFGISYALEGDFVNAEKYFLIGKNIDNNDIGLLENLGNMYLKNGFQNNDVDNLKKAIEVYNYILKIESDNKIANDGLNKGYEKLYDVLNWQLSAFTILVVLATEVGLYKTFRDFQKFPKRKFWKIFPKYNMVSQLIIVIIMCLITIPITLNLISLFYAIEITENGDMTNWATMISEITVGVMIAIIILVYEMSRQSKFSEQQEVIEGVVTDISNQQTGIENTANNIIIQQENISKLVEEIKQIQKEQHDFTIKRKTQIERRLLAVLKNIISDIGSIQELSTKWKTGKEPERQKVLDEIWNIKDHLRLLAEKNFDNKDVISIEFFVDQEIANFNTMSNWCKIDPRVDGTANIIDISSYVNLKNLVLAYIQHIEKNLNIKS